MSSTKQQSSASRQTTLIPMNQTLAGRIASNMQSSNKRRSAASNNRSFQSSNKKPQIHEIINLQNEQYQKSVNLLSSTYVQGKDEQLFVSQLAKKCGSFFNWINQVDYAIFSEQLWKNKMMLIVGDRFPQLNTQQQQKLIDRDWKIMAPQRKQELLRNLQKQLDYQKMNHQINQHFDQQRNSIYTQFNFTSSNIMKPQ